MKPGERGRLTIEAKVPVIEDSVVWKDYAAETVTLDHGDKHTPLDIAVVAGSVGIAIVEAQVLTGDGERVLEHTFEIEVVNTATDDDLIGHARLSRESPTFEGVTPEPEPQPEIPSATEIEEAENAAVSPMGTAEPEPVAAEVEPVAEPAPEPEAPVDGSDMMAGFQADAEANAALESPLTDAAEAQPIDEGNAVEEPAEATAETPAVDEEPVVDEGNTETVEEPAAAEEGAESTEADGELVEGGDTGEGDGGDGGTIDINPPPPVATEPEPDPSGPREDGEGQ